MYVFYPFRSWIIFILIAGMFSTFAEDKTSLQDLLKTGRVQFFDKDYDGALASFEKVLALDPQNIEARLGKMDAFGALRRPLDGFAKSASSKQTPPAETLILNANEKIWKRQFEQALTDLKQAIEKDPNAYMGHFLAAFIQRRSRKFDEALHYLKKAYDIAPTFPETSYLMGEVYLAKGQTDEALAAFQRYLSMVPEQGKRYESVTSTIRRIGGR